ncbi:MAG: OmpA family protein [Desulfobacterales bacterium]|jgi:OOP family OmpA-OmpF porin
MRKFILLATVAFIAVGLAVASNTAAFEIITTEDIQKNIITKEMLIRTADNFIVLYDASGSMADEFKAGVQKLDAELQILRQQNAILPELGYNAGLYKFTPFKAHYEMQPYDRVAFQRAIDGLPNTQTAGNFAGQPTPLAEGIAELDPILAKLSGKTVVFIFSDGTYTYNRVTKQRPLDAAKPLVDKYNVCFYLISSATTPKAAKLLDDMAALNECSRVIPFSALYQNPVWGLGALFIVKSTVNVETLTDKRIVGVEVRDINFAWDQKQIKAGDHENLKQVAEFLQNNPSAYAVLAGFTDSSGDPEYNLHLSKTRAQSAKNFILEQSRIDPDRIILHWYGATNFVADNDTEEGRFKNRRVEIAIGFQR